MPGVDDGPGSSFVDRISHMMRRSEKLQKAQRLGEIQVLSDLVEKSESGRVT